MRLAIFRETKRKFGRMVSSGYELRDGRIYWSFTVPSEHKEGQYDILVDAITLETDCSCEWHRGKRGTRAGLEHYGPVDILHPSHLCWHLNCVARWIKRHKAECKAARPHAIEVARIMREQARESA